MCDKTIMHKNLKSFQSLKYQVDGVKFWPYKGLKVLMHPQKFHGESAEQAITQTMMLSSFTQDKQLQKMLVTQVPMSAGATMFRDILDKMQLRPLIQKHMVQTAYLEIAFLRVSDTEVKSQRLIQKDLEKKTIQTVTTTFIRSLPEGLFSRLPYNKLLESKSTVEVENQMAKMAQMMQHKSPLAAENIKEKFSQFLDEIKQPEFHWPVKYSHAQKTIAALNESWNSEEYLQYVVDYLADILFHIVYHPKTVIHMAPWIATDRDLVATINKKLRACPWDSSLPKRAFLHEATCTTILDRSQQHDLIKVSENNYINLHINSTLSVEFYIQCINL